MSYAHYILQANIYLVIFYGFYKLLLDKETYFMLNRIYLISAGLLSFIIPFLRLEWFSTLPVAQPMHTGMDQLNQLMTRVTVEEPADKFNPGNFIALLYLIGIAFFTLKFIYQLISVRSLLKSVVTGSAFSFFGKKVIDAALPDFQTIHAHEEIHISQLHTLDLLLFEVIGIITWFNPVIYRYKRTVKSIHEYLADEEAAKFQGDKAQYALLLLSTAFGVTPSNLTNSFFNKSLIKKRIFMLHKQRSKRIAILKYGLFVPLFAVTLLLSSATIRDNEKIQAVADEIPLEQPLTAAKEVISQTITASGKLSAKNKDAARAGAGRTNDNWEDFYRFVSATIRYPKAAREAGLQGNSQIKFTLKNGEIEGLGIAGKPLGSGCDAEAMKTILTYKDFKNTEDGKYILPVLFRLSDVKTTLKNEKPLLPSGYTALKNITVTAYGAPENAVVSGKEKDTPNEEEKIYDFAAIDAQPLFPGGMDEFYKYLAENCKYPAEAKANNIQGKVFLSFVVEKSGELTNINVDRKLGYGTDEEAVRVLKDSPHWSPGTRKGKPVRVKYNIPISFGSIKKEAVIINGTGQIRSYGNDAKPLIIVDGVKMEDMQLQQLDPASIQSIDVIKDSSAKNTYGEAGKHGVIIVTTKAAAKLKLPPAQKGTD